MDAWCMDRMKFRRSSSSSHVVLNDEDLLTLILLRVPLKKLMSLKCVSRQWQSLISTPHFTSLRCLLPLRASGLFIQRAPISDFPRAGLNEVYFVPLDDQTTSSPFRTLTFAHEGFDPRSIRVLESCNGLLLCSIGLNCYVYNPSNNHLAILPKHPPGTDVCYIGLAFEPSKSLHYKVITFVITSSQSQSYIGDFHIYSSETRTLKVSVQSFAPALGMYFGGGVYWHGSVHWLTDLDDMKLVNWPVSDCLYFNVDECRLEKFPRPPISVKSASRSHSYFGESEDHLHFIEVCPYATSLSVHEMKSDYSEWFVKYLIDLTPISKVFPEMTKDEACLDNGNNFAVAVLSLIRRENFHEDSFLVLEIPGKAIRYNLVDRSFSLIWNFAVDMGLEKVDLWPIGRLQVWQSIETQSCV
ncbi:F-box domain-containing protein [Heracleum sosnowskyi]|uniref:F-box domain-containing protein n=1 Tax=Heracleum sosnowskyi TaxID=360622 RepID=A0AAD8M6Z4_9APIA|nr:F-box domain-containing protein [Heracleum sosnowskyi]